MWRRWPAATTRKRWPKRNPVQMDCFPGPTRSCCSPPFFLRFVSPSFSLFASGGRPRCHSTRSVEPSGDGQATGPAASVTGCWRKPSLSLSLWSPSSGSFSPWIRAGWPASIRGISVTFRTTSGRVAFGSGRIRLKQTRPGPKTQLEWRPSIRFGTRATFLFMWKSWECSSA